MYWIFAIFFAAFASPVFGSTGLLDGDLELTDGVRLVSIPVSNSVQEETGRSFGEDTVLYRLARFLQGHELHIKLPTLLEKDKMSSIFTEALKAVDETYKENAVAGRGRNRGNQVMMLGLMFAKTLGALGIGGVGMLTMKALAVSGMALLLSAIVGLKKHHHDDHDDHQVIYAGHGHHRRRRDIPLDTPLPYQGWALGRHSL